MTGQCSVQKYYFPKYDHLFFFETQAYKQNCSVHAKEDRLETRY